MSEVPTKISKTAFLKYDQCPKAFFLYKKFPFLRDPVSKEKQFTFNRGHEIGALAQQLFPGGIDVSKQTKNTSEAAELTTRLIANNTLTIYEATFVFNGALIMVDILHNDGKSWNAYEVKSSLKVSEVYIKDACLQYYVLKNSLPGFVDLFLVTMNGEYKLDGELNINQLFKKRSIKSDAEKNEEFFTNRIIQIKNLLEQNVTPDVHIGKHCFSPYTCDYLGSCWKNVNAEKSVFDIGKIDREQLFNWYNAGMDTVDKIFIDDEIKQHVKIQIESIKSNSEFINKEEVRKVIDSINHSCCFLDMEVWSPAVPKFKGHKPFEQLPFLFSLSYIERKKIVSKHYIIPEKSNNIHQFALKLIEFTNAFKSIVVFDKNLEMQVLSKIQGLVPELSELIKSIKDRVVDLADVLQNYHYYHPKFKGNFSLKAVSEIFNESSEYNSLDVQSGIVAMYKYESLFTEMNPIIIEDIKQQLIDYCHTDTITCLKFYEYLKEKIKD